CSAAGWSPNRCNVPAPKPRSAQEAEHTQDRSDHRRGDSDHREELPLGQEVQRGEHQPELQEALAEIQPDSPAFLPSVPAMLGARLLLDVLGLLGIAAALLSVPVDDRLNLALIRAQAACQVGPDDQHLLADLLGLVERPLVVLLGAVDDCLSMGTMRAD